MNHLLNRRRFLWTTSTTVGGLLALPHLPSLGVARAQPEAPAAKRLVILLTSNGCRVQHFWPEDPPDAAWTSLGTNARECSLSELPGESMSAIFGPSFNSLREKMLLVRGLDKVPRADLDGHLPQYTLSGFMDGGPTVDQLIASSSRLYPTLGAHQRRSLHMLIKPRWQWVGPAVSRTAGGVDNFGTTHPAIAFENVFSGFTPPTSIAEEDPVEAVDPRPAARLRVLRMVESQYRALRDQPRIGSEDRRRLEEHMTMLADLEQRFQPSGSASAPPAEACVLPETPSGADEPDGEDHLPAYTDAHIDIAAAALKCDLTRVVVIQLCAPTDIRRFSFLPSGGYDQDHHTISHDFNDTTLARMGEMHAWYGEKVARLLTALETVEDPETGQTFLDNSLVYWGNEAGASNQQESHNQWGYPVLLAGSAGGYLRSGRYVDYRQHGQARLFPWEGQPADVPFGDDAGRPYNELLITMLQAFGLAPEEYEQGGEIGFGDYTDNYQGYDLGDRRSPLPGLR